MVSGLVEASSRVVPVSYTHLNGVDVVVDVPNSSVALAVQGIAREKKKLVLFSSPGTTALTQAQCSPYGVQWTYTTYALSRGTATAVVKEGNKRWFILASDYAFGKQLAADTETVVKANGGEVCLLYTSRCV